MEDGEVPGFMFVRFEDPALSTFTRAAGPYERFAFWYKVATFGFRKTVNHQGVVRLKQRVLDESQHEGGESRERLHDPTIGYSVALTSEVITDPKLGRYKVYSWRAVIKKPGR